MNWKKIISKVLLFIPPAFLILFVFLCWQKPRSNPITYSRALVAKLNIAFENYRAKYGKYPEGENKDITKELMEKKEIEGLSLDKDGNCLDKWGAPLKMFFKDGKIIIISSGQNRKFDEYGSPNDDDIRNY